METNETVEINETPADAAEAEPDDPLKAENESLKQMLRIRDARDELTGLLELKGARSPALLFAYAVDDLQFDGDGQLMNAAATVRKIEKAFPEQFESAVTIHSINGGAGTAARPPALTKEALSAMKPKQIASLDWQEVKQIISE
jgi:hypothetical protein